MEKDVYDLYDLQSQLKAGIERLFPSKIWLRAEISAVKARVGGHCYLELSQSGENGLVAKAQAVIWSSRYRFIAPFFESVTGSPLKEGMYVLIQVQLSFSQLYGLTLAVNDIDPEFSLGENERQKLQTIERLKHEGLMGLQQELAVPLLPYRIAVISAQDAAGYRDFMKHLHENEYGFVFRTDLFPALMQGAESPASIVSALDAVAASGISYDLVAILRGGGGKLDLACFDDYSLSSHIARFPLPVYSAIGHDQDYHVCDMVAYMSLKTPTALADELVGMYMSEDSRIAYCASRLKSGLSAKLYRSENVLASSLVRINAAFRVKLSAMENFLSVLEARFMASDPREVLKKGYVLAVDGKGVVLKGAASVCKGDSIAVLMNDGKILCTVDEIVSDE